MIDKIIDMFENVGLDGINPTLPTTILGLAGLLFFYLYASYKNKKDNELKTIQNIQSDKQKIEAIERQINEFGTRIDSTNLSPKQKYNLLLRLIKAKHNRYLITAITFVCLAILIAFLLLIEKRTPNSNELSLSDLSLYFISIKKDGSLQKLSEKEIEDIIELKNFSDSEGQKWLKMHFNFSEEQLKRDSIFYFRFGEHFSNRLRDDRGNPLGWSVDFINGEMLYTPTKFINNIEFNVTYN